MRDYNFTGPLGLPDPPTRRVERIDDPMAFYGEHAGELESITADIIGKSSEESARYVETGFSSAEFGQAMYVDDVLVGFGLYRLLRGNHWQFALC